MAQVLDDGQANVSEWLKANGLNKIVDQIIAAELTYIDLLSATEQDLKAICQQISITPVYELKLKTALMKVSNSIIAMQSKQRTKIVFFSTEEQEAISKLHAKFDQTCKKLQEIQQNQLEFENQKKESILRINSAMNKIIEAIETKRKYMINEIDNISTNTMKQLNVQQSKTKEIKLFLAKQKQEIESVSINETMSLSQRKQKIHEIVKDGINKYESLEKKEDGDVDAKIMTEIQVEKIMEHLNKFCVVTVSNRFGYQCRFSDKYRSKQGSLTLNDDRTILSKPQNSGNFPWIMLDEKPVNFGQHCWRIKIEGRIEWGFFGITYDLSGNQYNYCDKKSCGYNISQYYSCDTTTEVNSNGAVLRHDTNQNDLLWDMMVLVEHNEMRFAIVGKDDIAKVPIVTQNASWTPHFVLGNSGNSVSDIQMSVQKIDAAKFRQPL